MGRALPRGQEGIPVLQIIGEKNPATAIKIRICVPSLRSLAIQDRSSLSQARLMRRLRSDVSPHPRRRSAHP